MTPPVEGGGAHRTRVPVSGSPGEPPPDVGSAAVEQGRITEAEGDDAGRRRMPSGRSGWVGPRLSGRWRWWFLVLAVVLVLVAVWLVTRAGGDATTFVDGFESPGDLGPSWEVLAGEFEVQGGAVEVVNDEAEMALARLVPGDPPERFGVDVATAVERGGVAFFVESADDFHAIVASPEFGTWNVVRVTGGEESFLFNTQSSFRATDTEIVLVEGPTHVGIYIDGRPRGTVERPPGVGARGFGLVGLAGRADGFLWREVHLGPADEA